MKCSCKCVNWTQPERESFLPFAGDKTNKFLVSTLQNVCYHKSFPRKEFPLCDLFSFPFLKYFLCSSAPPGLDGDRASGFYLRNWIHILYFHKISFNWQILWQISLKVSLDRTSKGFDNLVSWQGILAYICRFLVFGRVHQTKRPFGKFGAH